MQKHYTITIRTNGHTEEVQVEAGSSLLEAASQVPEAELETPCGGNGLCGKCRIIVLEGEVSPESPEELQELSREELDRGMRLACCCYPQGDCSAVIPDSSGNRSIQTGFSRNDHKGNLRFTRSTLELPPGTLEDQRSMLQRITDLVPCSEQFSSPESLRELAACPGMAKIHIICDNGRAVRVLPEGQKPWGFGIDIGTTTVVVYLIDILDGTIIGHQAQMNRQRRFGADVISRIQYASSKPEALKQISGTIVQQLDEMMHQLLETNDINPNMAVETVIAGNTIMLHLLAGVSPENIAVSPFIPVFTHSAVFFPPQLGFARSFHGRIRLLGSVSAYVGADITAGIYASGITSLDHPALFIDIGTNGECALWDTRRILCCSTAAGPAFEGASIHHGTGGVTGAVCGVSACKDGDAVKLTARTIDEAPAAGICGSGIIDAAALLLDLELMDETGRMVSPDEDQHALLISTPQGTALDICRNVYFTQGDVREVQLAKAAVAAGIRTLLAETGLQASQIGTVIIAGGFGQHIHIPSALRIGLLPGSLTCTIRTGGNTAGKGAVEALLNPDALDEMERIREMAEYIELSSSAAFQMYYIDEMTFPLKEEMYDK